MFVLFLVVLLSGDELAYGPGGETVKFPTKAACEKVLAEQKPKVEKANPGVPLKFECRKV